MRSLTADSLSGETAMVPAADHGSHTPDEDCNGHAVVITDDKGVICTDYLKGNITSVGRSRNNSINIDDPRFPRHAGDLILFPDPLFRFADKGGSTVIRLADQRSVAIRKHFHLHYLGPGDSFRFRKPLSLSRFRWPAATFMAITAIFAVILLSGSGQVKDVEDTKRPHTATAGAGQSQTADHDIAGVKVDVGAEGTGEQRQPATDQAEYPKATPLQQVRAVPPVKRDAPKAEKSDGLPDQLFLTSLKAAREMMAQGEMSSAAGVIGPFLPLLNDSQRRQLVETLDPIVGSHFRKAYMLFPFDRGRASRQLDAIIGSGMEFLPSYRKALLLDRRISSRAADMGGEG